MLLPERSLNRPHFQEVACVFCASYEMKVFFILLLFHVRIMLVPDDAKKRAMNYLDSNRTIFLQVPIGVYLFLPPVKLLYKTHIYTAFSQ